MNNRPNRIILMTMFCAENIGLVWANSAVHYVCRIDMRTTAHDGTHSVVHLRSRQASLTMPAHSGSYINRIYQQTSFAINSMEIDQ